MQTVCRVATGFSPTGTSTAGRNKRLKETVSTSTRNRGALLFTCAPLAALAAFAGVSGIAQKRTQTRESTVRVGQLTSSDAQTMARQNLTHLLGASGAEVTVESASPQEGVLFRREGQTRPITTRSWYVTLNTDSAQYLVRLNADTKQVYAVNRFDAKTNLAPEDDANEQPVSVIALSQNNSLISKTEGELRVRQCLRNLGIPATQATVFSARTIHSYKNDANATPLWEFSYECPTSGWGTRKLRICIDRRTGALENIWNPAAVLTAS